MSEETLAEQQDAQAAERNEAVRKDNEGVTLKPSAIDQAKTDESPEDRKKRLNLSDIPYHTYETEQIAKDRADEQKDKEPEPYRYEANGYTVEEFEGENPLASTPEDAKKLWKVTADDFERVFNARRDAEIFVETHALAHKDMPATIPSN